MFENVTLRCSECNGYVKKSGNKLVCTKCKREAKYRTTSETNEKTIDMNDKTAGMDALYG